MPAKLLGHPIHQMLVVLPLGLLSGAVVFDVVSLVIGSGGLRTAAWYMMGTGVIAGLMAAPFGLVDWLSIQPGTRAKSIGAVHGLGNVLVVVLFAISWLLRLPDPLTPSGTAIGLGITGFLLALVTGWLGGEMVDRLGVGVDEGANVNAPSSLSGRPATPR